MPFLAQRTVTTCPKMCKDHTPSSVKSPKLTAGRRKLSNRWVEDFKTMRFRFNIGREPQRIRIAILDTGADANHPDFKGKPIIEYKSFLEGGNAREDPSGHGTHIAGIILDLTTNVELYIAQITDSRLSLNRDRIVKVSERFSSPDLTLPADPPCHRR